MSDWNVHESLPHVSVAGEEETRAWEDLRISPRLATGMRDIR
jgi:hypothetical protein